MGMILIGITGTLGSGKGTVAEYLHMKHGFVYLSIRNFFAQVVLREGKLVNRENVAATAKKMRAEHGPNFVLEEMLNRAGNARKLVVESIRSVNEAKYLKSRGGVLWALDGDIRVRYNRVIKRAEANDSISFEQFSANEAKETSSEDPNESNLHAVRDMADVVFDCNATKEELFAKIDKTLLQMV